jgi:hypothetical protein
MKFVNNGDLGELTIIGEEKYDTSYINIVYQQINGHLIINDEYRITRLIFKEKSEKFYIFDNDKFLLYRPCFWQKITVNGVNAETKQQLIEWLTLLT